MLNIEFILIITFAIMASCFSSFLIASDFRDWTNLKKPSSCDNCQKEIPKWALIPVFGALFSRFTCSHCGQKFSSRMAIMEFSAAIFFVGLYLFANNIGFINNGNETEITLSAKLFLLSLTAGIFSLIAFEDWKNHYISDLYIMALTICLLIINFQSINIFAYYLAGAYMFKMIADNVSFYVLKKEEALGGGDILLFAIMGFLFSPLTISHFVLIMSIFAIIMTKRTNSDNLAPLAPNAFWAATILLIIQNY